MEEFLTKSRAVVFGGNGTLGFQIAKSLRERFSEVIVTSRRMPTLAEEFQFDFLKPEFSPEFESALGRADAIVISAAVAGDGLLLSMSPNRISETLKVNLETPLLIVKRFLTLRLSSGLGGRVVFVSSIAASTGFSGLSVYGATKAGLESAARALAREMGARDFEFYAVAPGFFESALSSGLSQENLNKIQRRSVSGTLVSPRAVANLIAMLAKGELSSATGRSFTLDEGGTL